MEFSITQGEGLGNNVLKGGEREAAERQTPEEHRALLDITTLPDYYTLMNSGNPLAYQILMEEAERREAEDPKYWYDDEPRRNITQSSSWVGDISYDPYDDLAIIKMGNNYYGRYINPDEMANLLNSPSIGRTVRSI